MAKGIHKLNARAVDALKDVGRYSDGVTLSFKVTATNKTEDEFIHLMVQGIDEDDFEISTVFLTGNIPIGGTKTLTTRDYIEINEYNQILNWIIG